MRLRLVLTAACIVTLAGGVVNVGRLWLVLAAALIAQRVRKPCVWHPAVWVRNDLWCPDAAFTGVWLFAFPVLAGFAGFCHAAPPSVIVAALSARLMHPRCN